MVLPELNTEYSISPEQREAFLRDGHICLRGVCTPEEIAAWRPTIRDAAYRYNRETTPLEERTEYGKAYLQITNLWSKDPSVQPFTLSKRFGKIVADLFGIDGVCLYHDQALFKEPGGAPTHWHQDQTYMPFDTPFMLGLWIPMVPIPEEIGSMSFVTGSHKLGWLGEIPFSEESNAKVSAICDKHDLSVTSYGAMELGDVTLHSSWTLHSAKGNPTTNVREIMNIFYVGQDTVILEPQSETHSIGLKYNLGGKKVGDRVESPENPLVYRRR